MGGGCAPLAQDRREIILNTEIFKRWELFRMLQMETQTVLLKSGRYGIKDICGRGFAGKEAPVLLVCAEVGGGDTGQC